MNLVIESKEFVRLSSETQKELLEVLSGKRFVEPKDVPGRARYRWRRPVDLTPDLAVRLVHGLSANHRRRLELFARNGGRASMKELLALTGDTDWHVLSYFQSVVTRKLRHLLGDRDKIVQLIGWDYDAVRWNRDRTRIEDGVYYVTEVTRRSLQEYFASH